jgi:DNA-binding MarR family transcriptional regulator
MIRPRQSRSLRTEATAALDGCAAHHSRMAARRISQFIEQRLAPSGLSIPQFGLMCQIAAAQDDSLTALAARMGLDPSTLSRNLGGLVREELVEIASPDDDGRRKLVWLTETGALKLEAAIPLWRAAHDELAALIDTGLAVRLSAATATLG